MYKIVNNRKKLGTVFICSVGIYRCEKLSSIKIDMNLTHNFDMLHSDMHYIFVHSKHNIYDKYIVQIDKYSNINHGDERVF